MFYIQQDNKILLFDEDKQRLQNTIDFTIPQYQGLEIKEVEEGCVIYNSELMTVEEKEAKEAQKERERLDKLSMTRGDVFEALILAKGLGKAQIRSMIEQAELDTVTKALYLNRFDEALEFYRGYPIFDMLGQVLGITGDMLDKFFETKDYHYLTTCTLTINPTPAEATVVINSEVVNEVIVPYGSIVDYVVSCDGYESKANVFEITKDEFLEVVLDEDTTDTTESDIQDELDTTTSKSDETDTDILE